MKQYVVPEFDSGTSGVARGRGVKLHDNDTVQETFERILLVDFRARSYSGAL